MKSNLLKVAFLISNALLRNSIDVSISKAIFRATPGLAVLSIPDAAAAAAEVVISVEDNNQCISRC